MRKPTSKDDIQQAVTNKRSRAKKKGASVSLPLRQIEQLETWVDKLTFDHRIKKASISEIVEAALTKLFESHSVEEMAEIAKLTRLKEKK